MITDNIFDLVSNKNKRIPLGPDAPILHINEIETILIGIANNNPDYLMLMPYLIEVFRTYLNYKKGNINETVVLTGTGILESLLQEFTEQQDFESYG